ncbi:D-2-hydroxyacid dehydrogenase [Candidatus Fermentibacterales bacterium]|nr:D-2-hydroxyacid dehydrogenase [Candidatus Fermentibacterales bacterium]
MARVLVCDPTDAAALDEIRRAGHEVVEKTGMTPEELVETVPDFDAMVVRSATKVRREVVERAATGRMKLIVRGGVGLDNIDLEAASEAGIDVRNTPAASSVAVAELALAQMLACSRYITVADSTMKAGEWNKKAYSKGKELFESTLGIIGMGRIGKEVARRAAAFGMSVLFYDPNVDSAGDVQARKVDLDTLCRESDYITLHVPHTDDTHYILDKPRFDMMKQGAVIINCGRGGTVNEKALLEALESGRVAFAGCDVYEEEPVKDNLLARHGNVVATPHIGAGTKGASNRVGKEVASIIVDYFKV